MERFGKKLSTLRKQRDLTMRELAKALGFAAHGYIGNLESGWAKPSLIHCLLSIAVFSNS